MFLDRCDRPRRRERQDPNEIEIIKIKNISGTAGPYDVNPTSKIRGFVTIIGSSVMTETFTRNVNLIRILSDANPIFVELAKDETNFGPPFIMRGNFNHGQTLATNVRAVRFTNEFTDGTRNGRYELLGFL